MSRERGQATVELALLLPAIVVVLLLAVQIGLVQRDRMIVVHGVRIAARSAIIDPSEATVTASLRAQGGALGNARVSISGDRTPGGLVVVRVTMSATVVPLLGALIVPADVSEQLVAQVEGTN